MGLGLGHRDLRCSPAVHTDLEVHPAYKSRSLTRRLQRGPSRVPLPPPGVVELGVRRHSYRLRVSLHPWLELRTDCCCQSQDLPYSSSPSTIVDQHPKARNLEAHHGEVLHLADTRARSACPIVTAWYKGLHRSIRCTVLRSCQDEHVLEKCPLTVPHSLPAFRHLGRRRALLNVSCCIGQERYMCLPSGAHSLSLMEFARNVGGFGWSRKAKMVPIKTRVYKA